MTENDKYLYTSIIKDGISCLGKHPLTNLHAYLHFQCVGKNIRNIEALGSYPLLVYIDISKNCVDDLSTLKNIKCLTQLRASHNKLKSCLRYFPAKCSSTNKWSDGKHAIGSCLTLADISCNEIECIDPLDHHPFLETLLLGHNSISSIQGLQGLKYLKILDLSYNKISHIQGLEGLPIQELSLEGNQLQDLKGLNQLSHLLVLNVSHNQLKHLSELTNVLQLSKLDVSYNLIQNIKEVNHVNSLSWLKVLVMEGNPCINKIYYRYRVIYRLQRLQVLDVTTISAEEKIRALNLYESDDGDSNLRKFTFLKYENTLREQLRDFPSPFQDDEQETEEVAEDIRLISNIN